MYLSFMAIFRDKIETDLEITESSSIAGQVHGCVTVKSKINLQIHGTVVGKLIIQENAEVFIHGVLNGHIINEGSLYVFGTVNGDVTTKANGRVHIDPKATVVGSKN